MRDISWPRLFAFVAMAALAQCAPAVAANLRAPGGGVVRAVVVGIDKYANLGPSAQLGGAAADARDIARALTNVGVATSPILDGDATRARFISEIETLLAASKSGDLVIISFAGHGMQVPEYKRWQGMEANKVNEQIVFSGFSGSGAGAGEVVVNKELKAWLSRFDAKGVDVLVIMDSCFGGGMSRAIDPRGGALAIRAYSANVAASDRDSFTPIQMNDREARVEVRGLSHVTFLAGATPNTVVPETIGLDRSNPKLARGALSFYAARAIEGMASANGQLPRDQLFRFVGQNVRQATSERQLIDIEPRSEDQSVMTRAVLRFESAAGTPASAPVVASPPAAPAVSDPIAVYVTGGPASLLSGVEKGAAPFVAAESAEKADLVWDAPKHDALARGDMVMANVDASTLGGVVDRTWAIRAIQRLAPSRALTLRLREEGKRYIPGESPELIASDIANTWLTVFNIAADGEIQMLFPANGRDPHVADTQWTYMPTVEKPFGADHVVALATSKPAPELLRWLMNHNGKHDATLVPAELAKAIAADPSARLGDVGLYTSAARE